MDTEHLPESVEAVAGIEPASRVLQDVDDPDTTRDRLPTQPSLDTREGVARHPLEAVGWMEDGYDGPLVVTVDGQVVGYLEAIDDRHPPLYRIVPDLRQAGA